MKRFRAFIDELLETKRKDDGKEPLLFVFFDDVDLCSERCTEILELILRYLSHAGVIVFIAGNYNTFSENVTIDYLRKDGLLAVCGGDTKILEKSFVFANNLGDNEKELQALNIRKKLSYDYLKKLMPPALRYEMPRLSESQRKKFRFTQKEGTGHELPTVEELLNNYIKQNHKEENEKDESLFTGINVYYKIFDDQPRGLINIYHFLYHYANKENDESVLGNDKLQSVRDFLEVVTDSSQKLSGYKQEIQQMIVIKNDKYYVDYEYLWRLYETNAKGPTEKLLEDDAVTLFVLANFFENVLERICTQKSSSVENHGAEVLHRILKTRNSKCTIFPKIDKVPLLLKFYSGIEERLTIQDQQNLVWDKEGDYKLRAYFECLKSMEDTITAIFQSGMDREWQQMVIEKIYSYGDDEGVIIRRNTVKTVFSELKRIMFDKGEELIEIQKRLVEQYKKKSKLIFSDEKREVLFSVKSKENLMKLQDFIEVTYVALMDYKRGMTEKEDVIFINDFLDIDELDSIQRRISNRCKELSININNEYNKGLWGRALQKEYITYSSCLDVKNKEENTTQKEKGKIEIVSFQPQEIMKAYNFDRGEALPEGFLVKRGPVAPQTWGRHISYFKKLEEQKLLMEYILPEIETAIDNYKTAEKFEEKNIDVRILRENIDKLSEMIQGENSKTAAIDKIKTLKNITEKEEWLTESKECEEVLKDLFVECELALIYADADDLEEKRRTIIISEKFENEFNEMILACQTADEIVQLPNAIIRSIYRMSRMGSLMDDVVDDVVGKGIVDRSELDKFAQKIAKLRIRKLQLQVEHFGKMAANSCSIKAVEKCIKKFFWSLIAESFTRAAI